MYTKTKAWFGPKDFICNFGGICTKTFGSGSSFWGLTLKHQLCPQKCLCGNHKKGIPQNFKYQQKLLQMLLRSTLNIKYAIATFSVSYFIVLLPVKRYLPTKEVFNTGSRIRTVKFHHCVQSILFLLQSLKPFLVVFTEKMFRRILSQPSGFSNWTWKLTF